MMENKEIKSLRGTLKLTQKELAAKLRVGAITINRWERNEKKPSALAERQLARLVKRNNIA